MNGRVLKATLKKETGYLQVRVGGENIKTVHTLVAKAFCDGYSNGLVVNHKNGIKTDNRAENLEWVTTAENLSHAYRELGIPGSCLGRFGEAHPTSKSVIAICTKTGKTRRYGSAMDAVREGFDSSSISRCCSGERSSHKGFAWKFEELAA
jgi:hypothetical protein